MIKKITLSLIILLFSVLSLSEALDTTGSQELDRALVRSLSTFAIARGLNGLISMAQGTEVNLTPAGVGVTFAPGELLDPINDMVERFSWVMLMSSVSIGIQEVMLHLGKTTVFKVLFSAVILLALFQLWSSRSWFPWRFEVTFKVVIILALLRFSVPILVMMNEAVYTSLLASEYDKAYRHVAKTSDALKVIIEETQQNEMAVEKESSFLDNFNLSKTYEHYKRELKERIDAFIDTFNGAMESIIRLITVFVINSVLLPLAGLWLLFYTIGFLAKSEFRIE